MSNLVKIRPVGIELVHAEGRTDEIDGTNGRLLQFCESVLKKEATIFIFKTALRRYFGAHAIKIFLHYYLFPARRILVLWPEFSVRRKKRPRNQMVTLQRKDSVLLL
jgi:hypothetical protein